MNFKYVQRQGRYHYFRFPGARRERLPGAEGSPEYVDHYKRLLTIAEQRADGVIPFPNARRSVGRPLKTAEAHSPDQPIVVYPKGTIGWVMHKFLNSQAAFRGKYRASTQASHCSALNVVRKGLGAALITDLKRSYVDHFCAKLAEDCGTARADQVRRAISLLWEFALGLPDAKIDEDRANPARGRRLHKVRNPHLPWPPQVQRQFLDGASDRLRLAYTLARYTGFRRGDICSIKWTDYDEKAATLYVQATEKTHEYVPMHVEPELAELLASTQRVHQCILTSSLGEPYTKRALTALFTQRLRNIGAEGYTLHGLRKTLAVELAEAGAAPQAIMHALGHKTVKQAMAYCERVNKAPMIKGAFAARRKNKAVA